MSKTITDGKVVDYDPFRGRKGADVSVCHHCGRPRTGCLKGLCLGGEACELQARLNEADGTIGELRQRISALETLAHAAIELRSYKLTVPAEVFARFDAAVKGAGLCATASR